jgi:hypothetical protein
MKATINAHGVNTDEGYPSYRYFAYTIEGGDVAPLSDFVSLRTAQILVIELGDGNAFMQMLFAIVNADADKGEYDSLIGQTFED